MKQTRKKSRGVTTTIQAQPKVVPTFKRSIRRDEKSIVHVRFVGGMQSTFIRVLNAETGEMVQMNFNGDSVPLHRKEVERLRKIGFVLDELEGA